MGAQGGTASPKPVDVNDVHAADLHQNLFVFEAFDDSSKRCDPRSAYSTIHEKSQTRCGRICCFVFLGILFLGTIAGIIVAELDHKCQNPDFKKRLQRTIPTNTTKINFLSSPSLRGTFRIQQGSSYALSTEIRSNVDELFKFREKMEIKDIDSYGKEVFYTVENDQSTSLTNCPTFVVNLTIPANTDLVLQGKNALFTFGSKDKPMFLGNVKIIGGGAIVEGKLHASSFAFKSQTEGWFLMDGSVLSNSTLSIETLSGFIVFSNVGARDSLTLSSINGGITGGKLTTGKTNNIQATSGFVSVELAKDPRHWKGPSEVSIRTGSARMR
eukprot:TRINITY_DN1722_c1_g1_i2.p1 TRINITY_DN1722_c1_g1~~TRINITY_DN1722_c1_g1_i2.p1  ORF type:complete len:354 (-),score=78.99 TRINITY_DN1722_c1_g1_i2:332-1315(-)